MFPFRRRKDDSGDLVLLLLRFGVGSVFLWFGLDKWLHSEAWLGTVPEWPWLIAWLSPTVLVMAAGVLEFLLGVGILDGRFGRTLPSLAAIWILAASLAWGVSENTIRDAGLLGACMSLLIMADRKSIEHWPKPVVANLGYAYFTYMLAIGIIYLRSVG